VLGDDVVVVVVVDDVVGVNFDVAVGVVQLPSAENLCQISASKKLERYSSLSRRNVDVVDDVDVPTRQ